MKVWGFMLFMVLYPTYLLASLGQAQSPRPPQPNDLYVQVRVAGGQPPPGLVRVELFRGNMPLEEVYCDSRGDYVFYHLSIGFYAIRVSLPGYESHYEEVPLTGGGTRNVLVNLRPGRDVSGRGSLEIDPAAAESSLAFPARARNELTRARERQMNEDFEGAVRHLKRAIELAPTFAPAHRELGLCYWRLGQLDEAQASLETSIEHDPTLLAPYLNLAELLAEKEAFNEAASVLLTASKALPDKGEPYFAMARIQLDTGHLDVAEKAALMALERDHSEIPEVHLLLANIYLRRDEPSLVVAELESYIEKAPDGDQVEAARSRLIEVRKDLEQRVLIPLEQYSDLIDNYRSGRHSVTAKALSQISEPVLMEASKAYRKKCTTDGDRMAAALLHTETAQLLGRSGGFHMNKAIEYLAHIQNDSVRAQWLLAIGYYFHGKRRFLDAVPFLMSASRLSPEDVETRLALGSAYEAAAVTRGFANLLEQAEKHYRQVLKEAPDNGEAHLRLGHVLKLMGRCKDASRHLNEALTKDENPDHALVANLLLGDIHRADGDLGEAIASYRTAVRIEPDCQVAATALSHALHRGGDREGSRSVMKDLLDEKRGSRMPMDAWWRYMLGNSYKVDVMIARMRQEVLQ